MHSSKLWAGTESYRHPTPRIRRAGPCRSRFPHRSSPWPIVRPIPFIPLTSASRALATIVGATVFGPRRSAARDPAGGTLVGVLDELACQRRPRLVGHGRRTRNPGAGDWLADGG